MRSRISPLGRCAAVVVACAALVTGAGAARAGDVATVAGHLPYTDPAVTGTVGFCDVQGRNIMSGKVSDKPFVWLSVGSTSAKGILAEPGRTAFLAAYQPRQGVDPGDWSGTVLTAASRYSNPAHPMVQATPLSSKLEDFVGAYPPSWDGLVQIRLLLGGSGRQQQSASYDATDIRVSGDTWQVVRGGAGPCRAGKAVSVSVLLNLPGAKGTPKPGAVASPPALDSSPVPGPRATSARAGSAASPGDHASGAGVLTSSSTPLVVGGVLAAVAGVLLTLWARRRRVS